MKIWWDSDQCQQSLRLKKLYSRHHHHHHHHHHVRLLRVVIRNRTYKTLKSLELVKVSSNNKIKVKVAVRGCDIHSYMLCIKCYYFKICDLYSTCWWIWLSQFRFKNIQWQYFLYIGLLCKFDQDWSSNPRDYKGKTTPFLTTVKIGISYQNLRMYGTHRNHIFCAGRQMYAD